MTSSASAPLGSPPRNPSLIERSPRSASPLAILQDAKDFLASPQLPPRALHRRPSLDPHKLPFSSGSHNGWGGSSEVLPGMKLPSLTLEDFTSMKRREGNVNSTSRGYARGDSHGKRRLQHAVHGSGTISAPVSRGADVSQLLTPMSPLDMPMTEPERRRVNHSPMMKAHSAVHLGGNTPVRSSSSSSVHRPPQPPKQRLANSRDQPTGSSLAEGSPCAMQALSPWRSGVCEGSPEPMVTLCQLSPSPMRIVQEDACSARRELSDHPVLQRSPSTELLLPRQLVECLVSAASSARGPSPNEFHLGAGASSVTETVGSNTILPNDCCLSALPGGSTVETSSTRPSSTVIDDDSAIMNEGSQCHSPCDLAEASYGWDAGDSEPPSRVGSLKGSRRGGLVSNLSCSHGPRGITALSVSQSNLWGFQEAASPPEAVDEGSPGFSWVRGDIIGQGSLGSVFSALNQCTGQIFAVKEVRIDSRDKGDVRFRESLENEISIYKELKHPRIVSYLGHGKISSSLYIYLEYMPGGSIRQVLSQFGAFDESLIATYTLDLVQGLDYLHTLDPPVIHRDVKGANILVGLDSHVKLSDFGCSKRAKDTLAMSLRGSIPWMAPEVIQQTGCGRRSDIWSLGCVVIEMATAKHPWGSFDNPLVAMRKIGLSTETPPLPAQVSDRCKDFIVECTSRDKNLRPTATTLLQHEFVRDLEQPLC